MKSPKVTDLVLVFNAGSSSLKFALISVEREGGVRARGAVRDIGSAAAALEIDGRVFESKIVAAHHEAAERILDTLLAEDGNFGVSPRAIKAVAHRVVHGGERYTKPTVVSDAVLEYLEGLAELAPLHIPPALTVFRTARRRLPGVPSVAVFDTALYEDLPEVATAYAVPRHWQVQYGIRRYGFHGIAHANMRDQIVAASSPENDAQRLVTLHLGHGCSATAFNGGLPVDTSMGFTPIEGLIMATRSGDIDPGAILYMQRHGNSWQTLENELNHASGLLGLSGASGDVRELLKLEASGHEGAALALQAFCARALKYLGAYAAVLGGIDALAFGGSIGENAPVIRRRICRGLEWLGLKLDDAANESYAGQAARISATGSAIAVYVLPVDEEAALGRVASCLIGGNAIHAGGALAEGRAEGAVKA